MMLKKRFLAGFASENNNKAPKVDKAKGPTHKGNNASQINTAQLFQVQQPTPLPVTRSVDTPKGGNSLFKKTVFEGSRNMNKAGTEVTGLPSLKTGSDDDDDEEVWTPDFNEQGEQLFCFCKKPYNERSFMIGCDNCDDWFHGRCVRIAMSDAKNLEHYVCPRCTKKQERLAVKKARRAKVTAEANRAQASSQRGSRRNPDSRSSPSTSPTNSKTSPRDQQAGTRRKTSTRTSPTSTKSSPPITASSTPTPVPTPTTTSSTPTPVLPTPTPAPVTSPPTPTTPVPSVPPAKKWSPSEVGSVSGAQCQHIGCTKSATSQSKYCSRNCSMSAARANLAKRRQLLTSPQQTRPQDPATPASPSLSTISPSPTLGTMMTMEGLQEKHHHVSQELELLDQRQATLKQSIDRAKASSVDEKGRLCGCPLEGEVGSSCQVVASLCDKHRHWESLRMSDLVQKRVMHEQTLRRLKIDQNLLLAKLSSSPSSPPTSFSLT